MQCLISPRCNALLHCLEYSMYPIRIALTIITISLAPTHRTLNGADCTLNRVSSACNSIYVADVASQIVVVADVDSERSIYYASSQHYVVLTGLCCERSSIFSWPSSQTASPGYRVMPTPSSPGAKSPPRQPLLVAVGAASQARDAAAKAAAEAPGKVLLSKSSTLPWPHRKF